MFLAVILIPLLLSSVCFGAEILEHQKKKAPSDLKLKQNFSEARFSSRRLVVQLPDTSQCKYNAKVALVGVTGVGKSCLFRALLRYPFDETVGATIGSDFMLMTHLSKAYGEMVSLGIWDTAGQERYRAMLPMHTKGADVVLLVFDSTDHHTLEALRENDFQRIKELNKDYLVRDCKVIVVAAKMDITDPRIIDERGMGKRHPTWLNGHDAYMFSQEMGYDGYVEVSSKTDYEIENLRNLITDMCLTRLKEKDAEAKEAIKLGNRSEKDTKSCCVIL